MAMAAGATYVCPLVGRLQDEGHDALALVEQCVDVVERYGYDTKVMFSSVRHAEHVRNALNIGVHTITAPWGVMQKLTSNNFTTLGTDQFVEHTKLMTVKVREIIRPENPVVKDNNTVLDAIVQMNESRLGAVAVVDDKGNLKGVFTDGDLRRNLKEKGKAFTDSTMGELSFNEPLTVSASALLYDAVKIFKEKQIDNIVVLDNNAPIGMLDIQDLVKMGLIG
jgi:CBS domain-containing protein